MYTKEKMDHMEKELGMACEALMEDMHEESEKYIENRKKNPMEAIKNLEMMKLIGKVHCYIEDMIEDGEYDEEEKKGVFK